MADKRTDLEVNVVARADQAKREIAEVADDARELEGNDVDVTVDVDDEASDELADIRDKLDRLSDSDKIIALKGNASQLQREIGRAERALSDLSRLDGDEIDLRIEARDNASRKLEAIKDEIRRLDGEEIDVKVDAQGLDDIRGAFGDLVGDAGGGGAVIAAGKAGMIGAAIAGSIELGDRFADTAIQAQAIADAFGTSVEDASRLLTVFGRQGFEFDDVFDLLAQLNQALADNPELAERLKIDPNDTLIDQFLTAVENLQTEIDDVGERGVVAAELFGEEGVRQIRLIETTVGDLRQSIEDVPEWSLIDDQDVERSREFKQNMAELQGYVQGAAVEAGFLVGALNTVLGNPNRNPLETGPTALVSEVIDRVFGTGRTQAPTATGAEPIDFDTLLGLLGYGGYSTSRNPGSGSARGGDRITIINPPGTPTATIEQQRLYGSRNGTR